MRNSNRVFKKFKLYLVYWTCYLLLFSLIEGAPTGDVWTAFPGELASLPAKAFFVGVVVEWLGSRLFYKKDLARFCAIYLTLLIFFAFILRLVDNYIILPYILPYWKKEALLSAPPFLYNAIKLQFLVMIPFCIRLFEYWLEEKKSLPQAQPPLDTSGAFIQVKCDRRMVKIPFADICYCEAQRNHISIYTPTRTFRPYLSVSELESQLLASMFIRVHRSFIVSLLKVESFTNAFVVMKEKKIPIGRSYVQRVKAVLSMGFKLEIN